MANYVRDPFAYPAPPLGNENQRAPQMPRKPLPGPSTFAQTEAALATFVPNYSHGDGETAADEFIAGLLERSRAVNPTPAPSRIRATTGASWPWIEMPPNGIPFDPVETIATPAKDDAEHLILSFRVPFGLDGVIKAIYCEYQGPSFEQGAGEMFWRIKASGQPFKNYGNIRTEMGSLENPRQVQGGLLIYSDQTIEFFVVHASTSSLAIGGTRVSAGLQGYYWPRR